MMRLLQPQLETGFQLLVLPDVFMTLDTLHHNIVQPLIDRYPNASVLLVGNVGLPNTFWPTTMKLTPDTHARHTARLLEYLHERK
eukprot:1197-Eustigmatos_ZCMA.PRE.1